MYFVVCKPTSGNILLYVHVFVVLLNYFSDINECEFRDTCPPNSVCANTQGKYTCTCNKGFSGKNCENGVCNQHLLLNLFIIYNIYYIAANV